MGHGSKNAPLTALIVEDVEENREMFSAFLLKAGFDEVKSAADSTVAVRLINEHKSRLDLVLLDIGLPDVDGLKVCHLIRSVPSCAEIPIVVLTAHDSDAEWERALGAGANDYLVKPINLAKCRFLMRQALQLRELRAFRAEQRERQSQGPVNDWVAELAMRYQEDLDGAIQRARQADTAFSALLVSQLNFRVPHHKVKQALRDAVLPAAAHEDMRMLSHAAGEFVVILPKGDARMAQYWLTQLRSALFRAVLKMGDGDIISQFDSSFVFAQGCIEKGEIVDTEGLMRRLTVGMAQAPRREGKAS